MAAADGGRAADLSTCFICAADAPPLWAVSECGHAVCSLCALRVRMLCDSKACLLCKRESPRTLVCGAGLARAALADRAGGFEPAFGRPGSVGDAQFRYADTPTQAQALGPTACRCPVSGCVESMRVFPNADGLRTHISGAHALHLCTICLAAERVFPVEYRTYSRAELQAHVRGGGGPGPGRGHPACGVCGARSYSSDELRAHLRSRHEACLLCLRAAVDAGASADDALLSGRHHWRDAPALSGHLSAAHYRCSEPGCAELTLVAFADELELRAHVLEAHSPQISGRMQRAEANRMRQLPVGYTVGRSGSDNRGPDSRGSASGRLGAGESSSRRDASGAGRSGTGQPSSRRDTPSAGRSGTGPTNTRQGQPIAGQASNAHNGEHRAGGSAGAQEQSLRNSVDREALLYGPDAVDLLGARVETLSLYVHRNDALVSALSRDYSLDAAGQRRVRAACREFQGRTRSAPGLVALLSDVLGGDPGRLAALCAALGDLQPDRGLAAALLRAAGVHASRLSAFPALPPPSAADRPAARPVGHTVIRVAKARPGQSIGTAPMGTDPSRNPLSLIGGSMSGGGAARSSRPARATFVHATASSSTVAVSPMRQAAPRAPVRDSGDFPALGGGATEDQTAHRAPSSASVLAAAPDYAASETFSVGESADTDAPGNASERGRRAKGRQTLLRYG